MLMMIFKMVAMFVKMVKVMMMPMVMMIIMMPVFLGRRMMLMLVVMMMMVMMTRMIKLRKMRWMIMMLRRNTCQECPGFTRATSCRNSKAECHRPTGSHQLDPHFALAWASKNNKVQISMSHEAAQIEPRTRTHILCERAQSKRRSRFQRATSTSCQNLPEKCCGPQSEHPDQAPALRATVRSP